MCTFNITLEEAKALRAKNGGLLKLSIWEDIAVEVRICG